MTPISSNKRRKKKTIEEILRGLLFAMIPTLMVAVVGYYGYIQNNSGTNSEKINNFNIIKQMEELIKYCEKAIKEKLMIDFQEVAKKFNVTFEEVKKAYMIAYETLDNRVN